MKNENIRKKAKMNKQTIILPESTDVRILKAAKKVVDEGIANIILVGDKEEIYKISKKEKIDINNIGAIKKPNSPTPTPPTTATINAVCKIRLALF